MVFRVFLCCCCLLVLVLHLLLFPFFRSEAAMQPPDGPVAFGATVQASILTGQKSEKSEDLMLDVTPLTIGLAWMRLQGFCICSPRDRNRGWCDDSSHQA